MSIHSLHSPDMPYNVSSISPRYATWRIDKKSLQNKQKSTCGLLGYPYGYTYQKPSVKLSCQSMIDDGISPCNSLPVNQV